MRSLVSVMSDKGDPRFVPEETRLLPAFTSSLVCKHGIAYRMGALRCKSIDHDAIEIGALQFSVLMQTNGMFRGALPRPPST